MGTALLLCQAWAAKMQWLYDAFVLARGESALAERSQEGFLEQKELQLCFDAGGPSARK